MPSVVGDDCVLIVSSSLLVFNLELLNVLNLKSLACLVEVSMEFSDALLVAVFSKLALGFSFSLLDIVLRMRVFCLAGVRGLAPSSIVLALDEYMAFRSLKLDDFRLVAALGDGSLFKKSSSLDGDPGVDDVDSELRWTVTRDIFNFVFDLKKINPNLKLQKKIAYFCLIFYL